MSLDCTSRTHRVVQGMVESDRDHDGRVPLLIIDGREITWDEFGLMLMSFEGWQFKLNLVISLISFGPI